MTMTDPNHLELALEHGDAMVAYLLLLDMKCEADDVRQVLKGIRADEIGDEKDYGGRAA